MQNVNISVWNMYGQNVIELNNINRQSVVFSRENITCGLYILRITEGNKIIAIN